MRDGTSAEHKRVRLRHILMFSLVAAIAANLTGYAAWAAADGAEDITYFVLRIGAVLAALTGAIVALRAQGAWDEAVAAGIFSTMLGYGLTWVPVIIVVLVHPPS
jgi:hypothetical protein